MNQTGIYRKAIQRTFAELSDRNDDNEFISEGEDPVTVTLTDDERYHLERRV